MMRWLTPLLIALIVLLQYPLWFGEGGFLRLWDLGGEVATQQELNGKLRVRNETLSAEVRDLKEARDAIEEQARAELGMIRSDEVFVRVVPGQAPSQPEGK
jgi:cell division protein FtsB